MEKVKLEFKTPKNKTMEYNDKVIEIHPFISIEEQSFLINKYISDYLNMTNQPNITVFTKYDYMRAEYNLIFNLLQIVTNIELEEESSENMFQMALLFEQIKLNITNYDSFKSKLDKIIENIKEEIAIKNSVGTILEKASEKLFEVLEAFSEFNPESLKELQEAGMKMMDELKNPDNVILKPISEKKTRRKKEIE